MEPSPVFVNTWNRPLCSPCVPNNEYKTLNQINALIENNSHIISGLNEAISFTNGMPDSVVYGGFLVDVACTIIPMMTPAKKRYIKRVIENEPKTQSATTGSICTIVNSSKSKITIAFSVATALYSYDREFWFWGDKRWRAFDRYSSNAWE